MLHGSFEAVSLETKFRSLDSDLSLRDGAEIAGHASLFGPDETIVADLGWSVFPERPREEALVVAGRHHDADRSRAVFRGGASGRFYLVSSRVRTSSDRVLERAVVMRIATGPAPELRSPR